MINYKGIFYNEEKEKKYYEGGAHFKYSDLVNILIHLIHENKKAESEDTGNSKDNLISQNNNNIKNDDNEKKISQDKKDKKFNNSNLLTINTNKIPNNIKIVNTHKYILNTEKNIDKEKARKKRLIELLNYNVKISPFNNNYNNYQKIFKNNSLDKNYKRKNLKTLGNNENLDDSYNYLNIKINHKKQESNNNLPLIQSSYFNNLSNKNMFDKNKNDINNIKSNIIDLKHVSKYTLNKTKISKDNLFLKNKIFSPLKNINSNRNKVFSNDYLDIGKNYDTINIYTNGKRNSIGGKLYKYLNNNMNKQKKNVNLKMVNFDLNKK